MKKKGSVVIIVIIVAIIFALGLCGVGGYFIYKNFIKEKVSDLVGDELAEEAIENATGGEVDIDSDDESVHVESDDLTMDIGADQDWPEDLPSYVPEFKYGTIVSVTKSSDDDGKYWLAAIQEVDSNAFSKYKSDLEGKGWEIDYEQSSSNSYYLSASKDDNSIAVTINAEESTGSVMVSIEE